MIDNLSIIVVSEAGCMETKKESKHIFLWNTIPSYTNKNLRTYQWTTSPIGLTERLCRSSEVMRSKNYIDP